MSADRPVGEHTNERHVTTSLGCSEFLVMLLDLHLDNRKTWLRVAAIGQRETRTRITSFPDIFMLANFSGPWMGSPHKSTRLKLLINKGHFLINKLPPHETQRPPEVRVECLESLVGQRR